MDKTKTYSKVGNTCFWIGFVVETLVVLIDKSAYINPYESFIFRITFLLFCIKIATTKYTIREWLCIILAGVVAFIAYRVNQRDELVRAVILIAACKDIPLLKEVRLEFFLTMAGCGVIIGLAATGLYGTMAVTTDYGRGGIETRYAFGLGHPNAFHCMLLCCMLLYLYVYYNKTKIYHYVAMMMINIISYLFTRSNTGLLIISATIFGAVIIRYISDYRWEKILYISGGLLILFCIGFSLFGAYVGNGYNDSSTFMYKLDKLLNGRYESCYRVEAARLVNWKLFGAAANQEYFDAGFVRVFYWYGVIVGIAYVIMNIYLIYAAWKVKDDMLLLMVCAISVYSLMEAHFISTYLLRNYLLLMMGYYWYQPLEKCNVQTKYLWQIVKWNKK